MFDKNMLIEPRENVLKFKYQDKVKVICFYCKKLFLRKKNELPKRGNKLLKCAINESNVDLLYKNNYFCSKSCAATYNNTHKTNGTRVSKLEIYLQTELTKMYPDLQFEFNSKTAINSELDIYIPSLKLAFELNGIFHYEPIFGPDKLQSIQNNDNRKFQACLERGIELCVIDSSGLKRFKSENAKKYLEICKNIINMKLCL